MMDKYLKLFLFFAFVASHVSGQDDFEIVFSWTPLQFEWPNASFEAAYGDLKAAPVGIKPYGDNFYFAMPRSNGNGHPVNLGVVARPEDMSSGPTSPLMVPFPNLEFQILGDCNGIQNVQGFDIDPNNGWMWLADVGREYGEQTIDAGCDPKLVVLDLDTLEVVRTHVFPPEVVYRETNFLNDLALDITDPDNTFAYFSDADDAVVIVYDFTNDRSWRVDHPPSMAVDPDYAVIDIENYGPHVQETAVDGTAVIPYSPEGCKFVYCPIASLSMYDIPCDILKNETLATQTDIIDQYIVEYPNKPSQNGGIIADNAGNVYLTELGLNDVALWVWGIDDDYTESYTVLAKDYLDMAWPDSFGIDNDGWLYVTTRGWPLDTLNQLVRINIGTGNYLTNPNKEE